MNSRPKEIEAHTNRWFFHPASRFLARILARTEVHPNLVSFIGVGFGLAAAYNYFHFRSDNYAVIGFVCMLIWHILDGTDGMLARLTGKATILGRAIDGVSDYTVFLSVYLALGAALFMEGNYHVLWLVPLAGWSHIIQAGAYERQREIYQFWVYSGKAGKIPGKDKITSVPFFRHLHTAYLYVQNKMDASHKIMQLGYDLEIGEHRRKLAAAEYKKAFAPFLHVWSLLSANAYTFTIFLCTWFFSPIYYFLIEVTLFNLLLAILLGIKSKMDARFLDFVGKMEKATKS